MACVKLEAQLPSPINIGFDIGNPTVTKHMMKRCLSILPLIEPHKRPVLSYDDCDFFSLCLLIDFSVSSILDTWDTADDFINVISVIVMMISNLQGRYGKFNSKTAVSPLNTNKKLS